MYNKLHCSICYFLFSPLPFLPCFQDRIPFAVVGSNTVLEVNGKRVRARVYPWGVAEGNLVMHFTEIRMLYYMTGYLSGQDGAILPAQDAGFVPQGKFIYVWCFIPYNKSFIDQACSFFACLQTHKKRTWPISSHLDLMLSQ